MVGLGVAVGSLKGRRETVMVAPCDMCDLADEHVVFRRFVGYIMLGYCGFCCWVLLGVRDLGICEERVSVFDWYKKFEYHKS